MRGSRYFSCAISFNDHSGDFAFHFHSPVVKKDAKGSVVIELVENKSGVPTFSRLAEVETKRSGDFESKARRK